MPKPKPTLEQIEQTVTSWVEENTIILTEEEQQRLTKLLEKKSSSHERDANVETKHSAILS